ncbi:MAG: primosomal protein N' [Candidatus Margulisbacteria bacterium]|jgi:primosomal protein N' (replication factor Y)|nr:primosomal protein N' [Candidatus Margulisiibacteriota bacterium]
MPLTPAQQKALTVIQQKQFTLVHGVTGSGKTEIYLQAAAQTIASGRQVIVLVPEISLTPQTIQRFAERFPIAVLHSALTPKERRDNWQKISRGEVQLVVGARSALFAPFARPGLIIIDEEQDSSYKQDNNPRYHAVRAAWRRAELCGAKVVLGTATPALETFYLFQNPPDERYGYVYLPQRINGRPLPPVEIIDLRTELQHGNFSVLSKKLQHELRVCLDARGKAVIFLNRRGFASFISCRACGLALECPRCSVSLVYHSDGRAKCHYCGYEQTVPDKCPACHSGYFKYFGTGTQKVETELRKYFGDIQLFRMDGDTTEKRGAHARIIQDFLAADKAVLLGTQMIAKGHDFPEVTLVGIISADTLLNLPDFRAAERTFQLLTQAAGRAGRGARPGKVLVQTYNPEHYAIQAAAGHDYPGFYAQELAQRRELNYPPFSRLTSLVFSAREETLARNMAQEYALKYAPRVSGPAPCILRRLRGFYRWQILLKDVSVNYADFPAESPVRIELDVDPLNMY